MFHLPKLFGPKGQLSTLLNSIIISFTSTILTTALTIDTTIQSYTIIQAIYFVYKCI